MARALTGSWQRLMHARHAAGLLCVVLAGLTPRVGVAQRRSVSVAGAWRGAVALTIGTPGGLGALVEVRPIPRLGVRAMSRGIWGTLPRGGGLALALFHGDEGRLYLSGSAGSIACHGDRDGGCSGTPRESSAALALGIGGEFPVSASGGIAAGFEFERWFAVSGPQPSVTAAVFGLRFHWFT